MSSFRKGQRLVCIVGSGWATDFGIGEAARGPALNEVVTCDGHEPYSSDWILLLEYGGIGKHGARTSFPSYCFRPLIEDLTAELARKAEGSLVHERPERVNEPQVA